MHPTTTATDARRQRQLALASERLGHGVKDLQKIVACVARLKNVDACQTFIGLSWFFAVAYDRRQPVYSFPNLSGMRAKFHSPEDAALALVALNRV